MTCFHQSTCMPATAETIVLNLSNTFGANVVSLATTDYQQSGETSTV